MRTPLLCALMLLCTLWLNGCAQRIRADVTAVAESGYSPHGETVHLSLLPGFTPESGNDPAEHFAAAEAQLLPTLTALGYAVAPADQTAQVLVHMYWFSTGPHPVYSTAFVRDHWSYRYRRAWRRPVVVVEDVYQRFLVIEAIQQATATAAVTLGQGVTAATDHFVNAELRKSDAKPAPPRANYAAAPPAATDPAGSGAAADTTAQMQEWEKNLGPRDAARALPAAPKRLLWRVTVMSQGSLARPERVLPELVTAALPWLGKSADVQVVVSDGQVVDVRQAQ